MKIFKTLMDYLTDLIRAMSVMLALMSTLIVLCAGCKFSSPSPEVPAQNAASSAAPASAASKPSRPQTGTANASAWAPPGPQKKLLDVFMASAPPVPCYVAYYRDRSESTLAKREVETLYWQEVADNFQVMARTLPPGSVLEIFVTSPVPATPDPVLSYRVPLRAQGQTKALYVAQRASEADRLHDEIVSRGLAMTDHSVNVASWIVEDTHFLATRAMTQAKVASLVVATDGEQNSSLVNQPEIPAAANFDPLVARVLDKCPPLPEAPVLLTLVQMKHAAALGADYPADAAKYADFIEKCARRWGIPNFTRSQPRALAPGL